MIAMRSRRQFERLVDDHRRRHVGSLEQLVHREPQHEAIDDGDPLDAPVGGRLGDQRVDAIERARGALGERHGQGIALGDGRPQLQVADAGDRLGQRVAAHLPAVEHLERALAGLPELLCVEAHPSLPCPRAGACHSRASNAIVTAATAAS